MEKPQKHKHPHLPSAIKSRVEPGESEGVTASLMSLESCTQDSCVLHLESQAPQAFISVSGWHRLGLCCLRM